ncbi:MAG: hypothetical protein ACFCUE_10065 [Candidatus Bathyarchaeia archaeon]|jgi:hypothetical protein
MPSIVPSYIYVLFASVIIGTVIITVCGVSTLDIKNDADKQQLTNLAEYVAAQGNTMILQANRDDANSTIYLNLPSTVGTQKYWIQIQNDTTKAWVTAGFGDIQTSSNQRTYLPANVDASGVYTSYSGLAVLKCETDGSNVKLTINGAN